MECIQSTAHGDALRQGGVSETASALCPAHKAAKEAQARSDVAGAL